MSFHDTPNNKLGGSLLDNDTVTALLTIFDSVKDHLSILGRDYCYRQVNSAYERAFATTRENIIGKSVSEVFGDEVFASIIKPKLDECFSGEEVVYRQDFKFPGYTSKRFMEVRYHPIFSKELNQEEQVIAVVVSSHDITLMKRTTDQLNDLARVDALTGLPNRRAVDEGIERFEANYHRSGIEFTLLFIDLDDFKLINDLHGHKIGDEVLHVLGERFRRCFRKDELIGRYGGDEFISIIPNSMSEIELERFKQRLAMDIERPVNVMGHIIKPRVSIGAAVVPKDGVNMDVILRQADQAMYAHKTSKARDVM
ncbi:diguanylate cyclase domain-containing protein [Litoribrevibacter euphylliae]|uniref:Diguanylate cyclase domain-containing protein n=1 Tax=Litoribrevibacter euphylliae TaxID=1834034 RepID=A0ABV7HBN9_9GAMM